MPTEIGTRCAPEAPSRLIEEPSGIAPVTSRLFETASGLPSTVALVTSFGTMSAISIVPAARSSVPR